jgi:hypothetical protein
MTEKKELTFFFFFLSAKAVHPRGGNAMRMQMQFSVQRENFWQIALMQMQCECEFQSTLHLHFDLHFYIFSFKAHGIWFSSVFFRVSEFQFSSEYQNDFKPFFTLNFSIVVMFPVVFLLKK